jgi:hypothetical protein
MEPAFRYVPGFLFGFLGVSPGARAAGMAFKNQTQLYAI